jgi:DNA mismatch endonuclease (patch repair protein)
MMAGIRGKNTRPERLVRSFLHRQGFRFRLHTSTLPGRPDLILPKYKLAIFVHGCFWHRHQNCPKATTPSTNVGKWSEKFVANEERDRRNIAKLRESGWRVFVLWECGLTGVIEQKLAWIPGAVRDHGVVFVDWP